MMGVVRKAWDTSVRMSLQMSQMCSCGTVLGQFARCAKRGEGINSEKRVVTQLLML